jgi:hypothetical protein
MTESHTTSFVTSGRFLAPRVSLNTHWHVQPPSFVSLTSPPPDKGTSNDTLPSAMDVLGQPGRCMSTRFMPLSIALHHIHTCFHDTFTSCYLYTSTKLRWTSTGATPFRQRIKSHCSLPHLTLFPIRLPFLNWLYAKNAYGAPSGCMTTKITWICLLHGEI